MNEKIYILLPIHNRRDVTRRFIECLKAQTWQNYHLILIDDGSLDGTADMVRENIASLTIIRGKGDWWWAGSLHQGYLWLRKQNVPSDSTVLIINDDTIFDPDFLEKAISLLASYRKTLLLAHYYSQQDGSLIDSGVHVDWETLSHQQAISSDQINCLSTRGLFLNYSDFIEIGGFYPNILPHYASDYEFTIRAHRKGFTLTSSATLKLWGDESTTGFHAIESGTTWQTLKQLFSIKSIPNPVVWSVYIILACPLRWKVLNLFRIWRGACFVVYESLAKDIHRILKVIKQ